MCVYVCVCMSVFGCLWDEINITAMRRLHGCTYLTLLMSYTEHGYVAIQQVFKMSLKIKNYDAKLL